MLKIGALDHGECPKCRYWDDTGGCQIIENITVEPNQGDVYCIDGVEKVAE